jgi:hypothetical protein
MAHTCEQCGSECYCDMEDHHSSIQPDDCPHFDGECEASEDYDDRDENGDFNRCRQCSTFTPSEYCKRCALENAGQESLFGTTLDKILTP